MLVQIKIILFSTNKRRVLVTVVTQVKYECVSVYRVKENASECCLGKP